MSEADRGPLRSAEYLSNAFDVVLYVNHVDLAIKSPAGAGPSGTCLPTRVGPLSLPTAAVVCKAGLLRVLGAESAFGAIQAYDLFAIRQDLKADCGRTAFFTEHPDWSLDFERRVHAFGELRPTSVDVLMTGPGARVAIECKFTEAHFGRCSRPGLPTDDPRHGNGDYRVQAGRADRCLRGDLDRLPASPKNR
jgi:hypothetical protein